MNGDSSRRCRSPQNDGGSSSAVRESSTALLFLLLAVTLVDGAEWQGEWITDQGVMQLTQEGVSVQGDYGQSGSLKGAIDGTRLVGQFERGNAKGEVDFTISDDGVSFTGSWTAGRNSGAWRGWRTTEEIEAEEPADFSGAWLSSHGILQLTQDKDQVEGAYGVQGWASASGTVTGRRLDFTWNRLGASGKAWLAQTPNGQRVFGRTDGKTPSPWTGVRLQGFDRNPKLLAGKIVEGRTENGMLYFLRMPDGWQLDESTDEGPDLIVLLHGSNWTTKGMVHVTAKKWPRMGRDFAILGIQGEQWVKSSEVDDLRFNYSYVNWMGRSSYRGFPNTDRASPFLVMKVIEELTQRHSFSRIFVGGHSQGGYLTYLLHMHYPEKLAGTFPIAGGLVMQAEPDVFDDEDLRVAQRNTPLAIVHGTEDRVVPFSTTQHIRRRFLTHDFSRIKVFSPPVGHPYDFLPIGEAVNWLDRMSTRDTDNIEDN